MLSLVGIRKCLLVSILCDGAFSLTTMSHVIASVNEPFLFCFCCDFDVSSFYLKPFLLLHLVVSYQNIVGNGHKIWRQTGATEFAVVTVASAWSGLIFTELLTNTLRRGWERT
jgi:hypothetical protein